MANKPKVTLKKKLWKGSQGNVVCKNKLEESLGRKWI